MVVRILHDPPLALRRVKEKVSLLFSDWAHLMILKAMLALQKNMSCRLKLSSQKKPPKTQVSSSPAALLSMLKTISRIHSKLVNMLPP